MISRMLLLVVACLCFPFLSYANDCRQLTASGNSEYPPYLWRVSPHSEQMAGAITLLMAYVAERTGIDIRLQYAGPWGRVQEEVAEGRVDLIAGAFYTKHRSYRMDYIRPAFQQTKTAIWVKKQQGFPFSSWGDLKDKAGVTVINNSFGQEFDDYAKRHLSIHEVVRLSQGLNMLQGRRVDYFLYEENPAKAYASELGVLDRIEALPHPVSSEELYLTISKNSPCNTPELRQKLSEALQQAAADQVMVGYLKLGVEQWKDRSQGD